MSTQSPTVHSVHVYDSDHDLIARLCAIVATSLRQGAAALIVATPEHRNDLVRALQDAGINVRDCVRERRYTMLDARDTLATFMRNGMPDPALFKNSIGNALASAIRNCRQGLTVFGEMVALLWDDGEKDAALALEELWNDALRDASFHLHCAYPRAVFSDDTEIHSVHCAHTHVLQ